MESEAVFMRHKQRALEALSTASYLFLIVGIVASLEMIGAAWRGAFHLNFAMLGISGIAIFIGLRKHARLWRVCALVFTGYFMVTLPVALLICLCGGSVLGGFPLAEPFGKGPGVWIVLPLLAWLLVTVQQYKILTHPAIRRLFAEKPLPVAESMPMPEAAPLAAEASRS